MPGVTKPLAADIPDAGFAGVEAILGRAALEEVVTAAGTALAVRSSGHS
jgi:hypothetical protein